MPPTPFPPISQLAAALACATALLAGAARAAGSESLSLSEPLSFADALAFLTAQSIPAKQAGEAAASAAARAEQTRYLYLPTAAATGSVTKALAPPELAPADSRSVGVAASLNVYRFGGDAAKKAAAQAASAAAELSRGVALLDAESAAADALLAVIGAERERQVAQEFVAVRRDSAVMARRLYERGVRPAQEAEKVEIDAANEEARLADAEVKLTAARAGVDRLAGQPLAVRADWPWASRLAAGSAPAAQTTLPDFAGRPERQALAETAHALDLGLGDLRARWLPSLDLSVGYQFLRQLAPDAHGKDVSGTLTLTLPLFDQLAARTDYEQQARRVAVAALDVTAKERELKAGWEEARTSFARAVASARARDQTLAVARSLYERSLKSFRSGVLSANELSLDQSRLYDTELSAVRGWEDVHRFYARLCRALGTRLAECVKM